MIADVCNSINSEMRKLGYIETQDESTLKNRQYRIVFDPMQPQQEMMGSIGSQQIRVSRIVHIRIQYPKATQDRWLRNIAEDQEAIIDALYIASTTNVHQKFSNALITEQAGGAVSDISLEYFGII